MFLILFRRSDAGGGNSMFVQLAQHNSPLLGEYIRHYPGKGFVVKVFQPQQVRAKRDRLPSG